MTDTFRNVGVLPMEDVLMPDGNVRRLSIVGYEQETQGFMSRHERPGKLKAVFQIPSEFQDYKIVEVLGPKARYMMVRL